MIFVFLFFAVALLGHGLCGSVRAKNLWLLAASLLFYSWTSVRFTALLVLDTALCWAMALLMEGSGRRTRRRLLGLCVSALLAVLGIFKYLGFFLENLRLVIGVPERVPEIALPLGISFYTFQLLSYVVDVYRGRVPAQRRFWMLLLYASLFHQCVAGPIVRYEELMGQLEDRRVTGAMLSRGASRFSVGLAKKAVLANACALVADAFYSQDAAALSAMPAAGLWLSGAAYMLQIYLDFSAYSDMAVGMGLMCGLRYPENFNYPYVSSSVTEFWRRWHITLGTFFRDYVYIPLGGNRRGRTRQLFNLLAVWLLTGLWHGASWNYVLWGLWFFVLLAVEKFLLGDRLGRVPVLWRTAGTLAAVYVGWFLFRFQDPAALAAALRGLVGLNKNPWNSVAVGLTLRSNWAVLAASALACTPLAAGLKDRLQRAAEKSGAALALYGAAEILHPAALLLLSAMVLCGNSYDPFLYWMF